MQDFETSKKKRPSLRIGYIALERVMKEKGKRLCFTLRVKKLADGLYITSTPVYKLSNYVVSLTWTH